MHVRRFRAAVLPAALAFFAAWPASTARAAENLLPNPGFETPLAGHPWMPADWDTSATGLPTSFFGRDTLLAREGRYTVTAASASNRFPLAHNWSQSLIADPSWWGKDLVFSIWTRSISLDGRGYVLVQAYRDTASKMAKTWGVTREEALTRLNIHAVDDPLIDLGWKRLSFDEPETDWVRREVRVYVPPTTNMVYLRAGLYGLGQIFLDDASVTLEPALPPDVPAVGANLLADPDFEGDAIAWELSLPAYPDLGYGVVSDTASSGTHAYRFDGGGAMVRGKMGIAQVFANRGLAGKRLRLTGDMKADSLLSLATLRIVCHTPEGPKGASSHVVASGTMPWTRAEVEMDAPEDTYEVWAWFQYYGPVPGVVWFDNASLEVLGPAEEPGKKQN